MKKEVVSKVINIIFIILVLVAIYKLFGVYKIYSFNGFTKAENKANVTSFTRDKDVKCTYKYSYKLDSQDYNDAMFYKSVQVKPNTPYKLTCMVKTENIEIEDEKTNGGAQISILNSTECSESIVGTSDWKKIELIFDSKNRDRIDIGFRLGGNGANAKGIAWFSDFKLEEGIKDNSTNWNMVCFIIKNVDVNVDNQNLKVSMSQNDVEKMRTNIQRFKTAMNELSESKMSVEYDIYEIDTPITNITYNDDYGYFVSPSDVKDIIKDYLSMEDYDHIFVATKLGDIDENVEIPVHDWIGLRRYGFKWNRLFKYKITK